MERMTNEAVAIALPAGLLMARTDGRTNGRPTHLAKTSLVPERTGGIEGRKSSSELAFEDFLRRPLPLGSFGELNPPPAKHLREQAYQADTDAITEALRVGSPGRLEVVLAGSVMAA